jgi:hypothetical protein
LPVRVPDAADRGAALTRSIALGKRLSKGAIFPYL